MIFEIKQFAFTIKKLFLPTQGYLPSVGVVVLATLAGLPFASFDHANIVMLYLLAEVIVAIRFGLGPSIVAALASVIAYHYFFILPQFTFAIDKAQYLLTFAGLLIVGLVISTLTARVQKQVKVVQHREAQTAASYSFSRALASAIGLEEIIQTIISHVNRVFRREVVILLLGSDENMLLQHTPHPDFVLDENEQAVATWTLQNAQSAGSGTQTLSSAQLRYHPLKTSHGIVGVLGVRPPETNGRLSEDQVRLLEIFTNQAAIAIERIRLDEQAQQAQLLKEKEKLQTALLNSISHDLRTPLASITGVLSTLLENESYFDEATQQELIENAYEEADRLNHLVTNLLDMTRLQAGTLRMIREVCDIQDLIGVALSKLDKKLQSRSIQISLPTDLPLVSIDFVLMVQVMVNLIDNAHKYSPPDLPIEVRAIQREEMIEINVIDQGLGIPEAERERVFEKFYRVQRTDGANGTGLGLSICQGIVEVHGGQIWVQPGSKEGTIMTIILPLEQSKRITTEVNL